MKREIKSKHSNLEEMNDRIIAPQKTPPMLQPAETTDPERELALTMGLGHMHLLLKRLQREIARLQSMPTDELDEVEIWRLNAFSEVLSTPLSKSARFASLYRNPIFNDVLYTENLL